MFESLVVLLIIGGVLYIMGTWLYKREIATCPKYRYVYRPAVRTFVEEETEPPSVYKMYSDMFYKPSLPTSRGYTGFQYNFTGGTVNPLLPLGGLPTTDIGTVRESDNYLNDT